MNELVQINNVGVELSTVNDKVFTNTRQIAKVFDKRHGNVLKIIEDKAHLFNQLNFQSVEYKDKKGEKRKSYDLDKDFTAFVILSFTGKKADKFKREYIGAFNKMEAKLIELNSEITNKTLLLKDEQLKIEKAKIKQLRADRKLCKLEDGYTSIRGVQQRTGYTEKQIREMLKSMGGIESKIRKTPYWEVKSDLNGLVSQKSTFSTPYVNFDKTLAMLEEFYPDVKVETKKAKKIKKGK